MDRRSIPRDPQKGPVHEKYYRSNAFLLGIDLCIIEATRRILCLKPVPHAPRYKLYMHNERNTDVGPIQGGRSMIRSHPTEGVETDFDQSSIVMIML